MYGLICGWNLFQPQGLRAIVSCYKIIKSILRRLAVLWHYPYLLAVPVESVSVRGRTEAHEGRMIRSPGPVTYNWDVHGYLECVVAGGYPKPELRIYALDMHEKNRLDLSNECYTDFNMTFKGRKTGLQKYHYHQRCYSDFFRLDPMYDGGKIVCEGFVQPNVSAQTRTLAVNVKCKCIEKRQWVI